MSQGLHCTSLGFRIFMLGNSASFILNISRGAYVGRYEIDQLSELQLPVSCARDPRVHNQHDVETS